LVFRQDEYENKNTSKAEKRLLEGVILFFFI